MHLRVAPGDRNEFNLPALKSLPKITKVSILILVALETIVPALALPVSIEVSVKSRGKLRGRFSSTHTSTDPSFSTTTYDSEDNDRVGTAKNK